MKRIPFLYILFILFLMFPLTAKAEDGVVPYSIEAVIPDNQINEDATYFDIEMVQGETQELEVIVYNSSDEKITVDVDASFAATNSNGIITYDGAIEEPHESMSHPFDEIAAVEEDSLEIAAASQETVTITVEAPDESFDGVILGGLYFTKAVDESEDEASLEIQNRYSYALAVQIREAGNDSAVEPELEFVGLEPGIVNHRTGLQTQFANTRPTIIDGLEYTGSIYEEGSDEPLYTRTREGFTIAPNSQFNFPIMFENQRMEPGNYVFRATAQNGDNEWSFEEPFEITAEAAEQANDEAVELEEDNSWMMTVIIIFGALIVLLLLAVIYLLIRRRK